MEQETKVYVAVEAVFHTDGQIEPKNITWENGRRYFVDRIQETRRAASRHMCIAGIRYSVRIGRSTTCMYLEDKRWFVERRKR